jgi:CheY-like chemotaxis protein
MNTAPRADAILIVVDDADSREMLVEYLQGTGFAVHAAPTGETALAPGRHLLSVRNPDGSLGAQPRRPGDLELESE